MPKKFKRPTLEQVKIIHRMIIENEGQTYLPLPYIKEGIISSILEGIDLYVFGEDLYPTKCDKAIKLLMEIESAQAFPDGNKRVALAVYEMFLSQNKSEICKSISQEKKEKFMLCIANKHINKEGAVKCCIKYLDSTRQK